MDKALGTWCSHLNGLRWLLNNLFPVVENTHERVRLKVNRSQESFRIMLRGNHAKCLDNLDIWLIVNMIEVGVWSVVWQNEPSSEVSGVSTTTDTMWSRKTIEKMRSPVYRCEEGLKSPRNAPFRSSPSSYCWCFLLTGLWEETGLWQCVWLESWRGRGTYYGSEERLFSGNLVWSLWFL